MAEYLWRCIYCNDSVRGNTKSGVFEQAEKHNRTHPQASSVQIWEIEKVGD